MSYKGYSQYGGNPYGDSGSGAGGYGQPNPYEERGNEAGYGGGNQYGSSRAYGSSAPQQSYQQQPPSYPQNSGYNAPAPAAGGYGQSSRQEQSSQQPGGTYVAAPGPAMSNDAFLSRVSGIQSDIQSLGGNVAEIGTIHQKMLNSPDNAATAQLEHVTTQTQILNTRIKDAIKQLEGDALKSGGSNKTKESQIRTLKSSFDSQLKNYRQEEYTYQQRYKEQIARQFKIVKPDATAEEVSDAVNQDFEGGVFQTALQSNRVGAANTVLGSVRARHNDIQKIEKTLTELAMLFQQLDEQVVLQETQVQQVEQATENTTTHIKQGNVQLDKGVDHARRARKLKWWCLFIVVLILVIVGLALGLYFGLNKAANKKQTTPPSSS